MFVYFLSLSFFVLYFNQYWIFGVDAGISADKCVEYEDYAFKKIVRTNLLSEEVYKILDCYHGKELISDGVAAKVYEFPHFALLGYQIDEDEVSFKCGGSLISERFILSAAHCETYDERSADKRVIVVRLGEHNLTDLNNSNRKDYDVEEFIPYKNYNSYTRINDIALIKLTTDVTFSTKIRPACLHQDSSIKLLGNSVVAIGFGNTGYARDASKVLLKVTLSVINPNLCKKWVRTDLLGSQVCIQGAGAADTCSGDSGGPVQQNKGNCTYELMAITSYGGVCSFGEGAVYTRISSYIPWIENIVWK